MSLIRKKDLVIFGTPNCDTGLLDKSITKKILRRNPSVLASIYRRTNQKNKAIQALQHKLVGNQKVIYNHEILYNYIYFEDYDGAMQRIASLNFRDETIERLLLQIFIHEKTQNEKVCCGSDTYNKIIGRILKYLFTHFSIDVFSYFTKILEDFCNNNNGCKDKLCGNSKIALFKKHCNRKYMEQLSLESLKYIYHELGLLEALRLIVHRNPKVDEFYFKEFARKCLPTDEELKSILNRVYSPSLFSLLKERDSLTRAIVELKKHYKKDYTDSEVSFESEYCTKIGVRKKNRYLSTYDIPDET
ncbi:uncharacterized protein Eint_051470 [Encephalitozoon intestinalis ATCC 50506]|uniref:Uncharacterized protein n=1 Tax=Encephalitozoon intestinalis (strain ATCC 50506) TaxID=876142 RepID=E0S708_ENCIT|nr:uncharacterized protein Eint_051470 [Encephalitozoon intestinalis ATCC 50506]ADM11594.1 hypothetical protein Eint_051470 [Encephalitozoon intestinalis ATCC 50506]UTX45312.1 hypothetical protein GPK93_05g08590 [Encephalitozoon intestinalis]